MAHELEIVAGQARMFSVKQTPWHGLGHIVAEAPTAEEAIKLAGLDWKVVLKPLYAKFEGQEVRVSHRATVRESDNSILGVVGPNYTPLQNEEAFKWFNPFVDSKEASFETAGSLFDGKRIWVLAKLNKAPIEVVKGDEVNKFLLLSNSHDGSMSVRTGFTPIRVVCNNTLSAAIGAQESSLIRLKHSAQVVENLEEIRATINLANQAFETSAEQYKLLARRQVHKGDLEKFVKIVFFQDRNSEKNSRKALAEEKLTQRIQELFETGRGQDIKKVKGTYWALYNAGTEYLSYDVGKTQDKRLNDLWFGKYKQTNDEALKVCVDLASA